MIDTDETPKEQDAVDRIIELAISDNIADDLDKDELRKIGLMVIADTKIDDDSRSEWLSVNQMAMEIAKQVLTTKSTPWDHASNIKYPLITDAVYTFAARQAPQIVRGDKVVEAGILGNDPDGKKQTLAARLSKHMSSQLLLESNVWQPQTDRLLTVLGCVGTVFRKLYWNMSSNKPCFELCIPENVIVNNNITSIEQARRVTHKVGLFKNDIIERMRSGIFCEFDIAELEIGFDSSTDATILNDTDTKDSDAMYEFLEQHRYLDLDKDGYDEPYIVTVHTKSGRVLRIAPRFKLSDVQFTKDKDKVKYIEACNYFIDYHLLPSPDGSFYSMGYGTLLYPLNDSINTVYNQLIDAGTLSNMQGGLMASNLRITGGEISIQPGKFQKVEGVGQHALQDNIMAWPFKEPSTVLLALLELMIKAGKEIGSITEILSGEQPTQNSPATSVLSMIRQGLTKSDAIHKRVVYSFQKEFNLLYELNCEYLDKQMYVRQMADPNASPDDYNMDTTDVLVKTVADPNMSSDEVRIYRAQSVMSMPIVNPLAAATNYLQTLDFPDSQIKQLIPSQLPPNPETELKMAEAQLKKNEADGVKLEHLKDVAALENDKERITLDKIKAYAEFEDKKADIRLKDSQAMLAYAQANAVPQKLQIDAFKHALGQLEEGQGLSVTGASQALDKFKPQEVSSNEDQQGTSGSMAEQPSDAGAPPPPQPASDGSG